MKHYAVGYNPTYAHDYYMRTRQLKGRQPAKGTLPTAKSSTPAASAKPSVVVKLPNGKSVNLTPQQLAEAQAHAAQRVNEIRATLVKLQNQLKTAMAKHHAATNKQVKGKKPLTSTQKSRAKQKSKQYQQAHKSQAAAKRKAASPKSKTDPVANLQKQIAQTKGALTAALAQQQALKSASKNG